MPQWSFQPDQSKQLSLSYTKKTSRASIEIDQPKEEGQQTIKTLRAAQITHDFHYAAKSTQLASLPAAQRRQSWVCHAQYTSSQSQPLK